MAEIGRAIPDRPIEWRPICNISFSTHAPAAGCQQFYAEGKYSEILALVRDRLPKDVAGNFAVEQERFRCGSTTCWPTWRRICCR